MPIEPSGDSTKLAMSKLLITGSPEACTSLRPIQVIIGVKIAIPSNWIRTWNASACRQCERKSAQVRAALPSFIDFSAEVNQYSLSMAPLITLKVHEALLAARQQGRPTIECSLDLERSRTTVTVGPDAWTSQGQGYPYLASCKDRTVYYWTGQSFEPVARFTTSLIKLVPTDWGPPTFEIDGIKMLPTAQVSPYSDAEAKVAMIEPRGKTILDTCAGLGYFAAWCLKDGAARILSFEKSPDVCWLRSLNPWSPPVRWCPRTRRGRRRSAHRGAAGRILRRNPPRSAALRHRRRTLLAGVLRSARSRNPPQGSAVSLHRDAEQAHEWA